MYLLNKTFLTQKFAKLWYYIINLILNCHLLTFSTQVHHIANVSDGVEGTPASPHGVGVGDTSVHVTGLTANTQYIVLVCARTTAGCSLNTSSSIITSQDGETDIMF